MTMKEVLAYLEVSRPTVYKLIAEGRLTRLPKANSLKKVEPLRFAAAEVYALRPEKQPQS